MNNRNWELSQRVRSPLELARGVESGLCVVNDLAVMMQRGQGLNTAKINRMKSLAKRLRQAADAIECNAIPALRQYHQEQGL